MSQKGAGGQVRFIYEGITYIGPQVLVYLYGNPVKHGLRGMEALGPLPWGLRVMDAGLHDFVLQGLGQKNIEGFKDVG